MNTIKPFQYLRFPWRFKGRFSPKLMPPTPEFENELEHLKEGFMYAIEQTMENVAQSNFDFLAQVMEPKIYQEYLEGLKTIQRRGHKLSLINQGTSALTYLYNEEIHCGVNLERSLNTKEKYKIDDVPRVYKEKQRVGLDRISFYGGGNWESHVILKLDVVFNSPCKFVVLDENQEVVVGTLSNNPENHIFRFETALQRPNGRFFLAKSVFDVLRYFVYSYGKSPFNLDDWIITDIDNFLNNNPYLPEEE